LVARAGLLRVSEDPSHGGRRREPGRRPSTGRTWPRGEL